jgi:2-polyprenyl-3-methyl-5-hydroxy-6-metoxy-1,4-benzoquinol methylase
MKSACKEHACDLCGSTKAVEVPYARLYTNDQPVHICRNCGFVYVVRRRSADAVARAWSEEIFGEGYTARIPAVVARQVYVAEFIDTNLGLKGKKLIDIGAGEGQFLEIARKYGADVFGVEPSASNCAGMKKKGIESFHGTIEDFMASKKKGAADIATVMWTLENCVSCRNMLEGAWHSLKTGGRIAIATGSRILVPFKKPIYNYLSHNPVDTHCFRFSANTLRGILAVSGFKTVHINRYIDTDYLVVIAEKQPRGVEIPWQKDDFVEVHNYFERWHRETAFYSDRKS